MNKKYVVFHQLNQNPKTPYLHIHSQRKKERNEKPTKEIKINSETEETKKKQQQQISKAADKMGACKSAHKNNRRARQKII